MQTCLVYDFGSMVLLPQPSGFDDPSDDFLKQVDEGFALFRSLNFNVFVEMRDSMCTFTTAMKLRDDLLLECLNDDSLSVRAYSFIRFDGVNYFYDVRTV